MRRSTRMQLAKAAREQGGMMRMGGYEAENRGGRSEMGYGGGRSEMEMRRGGGRGARSEMEMGYGDDMGMEMRRGGRGGAGSKMEMGYGGSRSEMEMRRGGGRGNSGGGGRSGARSEMDMEMEMGGYGAESRFRDRRGREHYDNGRFAPMRSSYAPYGPYGGEEDGPFGRSEGGGEMREIGFNANWGGEARMGSDASIPYYNEMERMPGNQAMMGGYMAEHQHRKLDEQTAMEWVRGMKNEDGSKSPHWTMDQVKQVVKQKGLDKEIEVVDMFAILNALYSDYDPIFKKHGVSNMDFYVDMAKAWIKDKDAVPNKAMAYYECIVK